MSYTREKLPVTRRSITHKVILGEVKIFITIGLFDDGRPGELFIKAGCVNSIKGEQDYFGLQGWCNVLAIMISITLQAGVPIELICRHLIYQSFKPDGFADTDKRFAKSIVDYIARWMMNEFKNEKGESS